MAYEFNGTNQNLSCGSAQVTAAPLTIAAWFRPDTLHVGQFVAIDRSSVRNDWFGIGLLASGKTFAICIENGGYFGEAQSATSAVTNTWQHCCGVFPSSASRTVYLDGGNSGTQTFKISPGGVNGVRIGSRTFNSTQGIFFDGRLSEVGIWNTDLTASEIASLAKGMTCDKIRPQSLVFYAPLVRDLQDVRGGLTITNNNAATVANHPRVYA